MDQTTRWGLTHRRRLRRSGRRPDPRARAGSRSATSTRRTTARMCPIETPEGPNIGLIGSLSTFTPRERFWLHQTPYRKVDGEVTEEIVLLPTRRREGHRSGEHAGRREDRSSVGPQGQFCRRDEARLTVPPEVDLSMDVSP